LGRARFDFDCGKDFDGLEDIDDFTNFFDDAFDEINFLATHAPVTALQFIAHQRRSGY
jgi:hypothetical protein